MNIGDIVKVINSENNTWWIGEIVVENSYDDFLIGVLIINYYNKIDENIFNGGNNLNGHLKGKYIKAGFWFYKEDCIIIKERDLHICKGLILCKKCLKNIRKIL